MGSNVKVAVAVSIRRARVLSAAVQPHRRPASPGTSTERRPHPGGGPSRLQGGAARLSDHAGRTERRTSPTTADIGRRQTPVCW